MSQLLDDEISISPPYCPSLFLQVCLAVFGFLLFSFLVLAALACVLCWCYSSYSWLRFFFSILLS